MASCLEEASPLWLCLQETPKRELGPRRSAVRSLELEEAEERGPEETSAVPRHREVASESSGGWHCPVVCLLCLKNSLWLVHVTTPVFSPEGEKDCPQLYAPLLGAGDPRQSVRGLIVFSDSP